MKKILFVAGITLTGLSVAFAQEMKQDQKVAATRQSRSAEVVKRSPESVAQHRVERLDKELSLSAEQKQKLNELFVKDAQAVKGRSVQRKETETQVKAILTPVQVQKYEAVKAERKQVMLQRRQQAGLELKAAPGAAQQKQ